MKDLIERAKIPNYYYKKIKAVEKKSPSVLQ
jgi:hypothetical protein